MGFNNSGPSFVNGLPPFGNWGGPGWSAGQVISLGVPLTDAQKAVIALGPLDAFFKQHDLAYDAADKLTNSVDYYPGFCIKRANNTATI